MLKRIVIPGMIGRKKDSFLMWLVIVLSIVFSISATILFTSSEHAKYIERIANYGSWPFGVLDTDIDTAKRFENKFGEVVTFHTIGNDPGAGMVAAVEPERLERIGGLRLIEGAMPSQPDEIAFEYARRGYFATGVKVGERNRIELELYRNVIPEHEAVDRLFQVRRGFDAYRVQVEYDDSTLHYFFAKMVPVCETPEEFASLLDRLRDRSPEFSQDVLDTFFDPEFQKTLNHVLSPPDFVFYYQGYSVVDSDTVDGYLIRRYRRWFYKGQALKAEAGETREQLTKRIMEIGLLVEDRVVFYADMLATGVLMDYSKSWDRGEKTLPSALIHPSMEVLVLNAFENAAFNDFTAEELALYRTFGRTSVFASPDQVDLDTLHETAAEFAQTISSPQDLVVNETIYPAIPPQRDVFLMNAVIALIFVATMVCIFQINLAQFKRRTRKLMLFQSIGMTRGQIGQMLGSEVGILLLLAVPTGLVFGLLFAWCAVQVGTRHFGFSLVFYSKPEWIALGVLLSALATVIGFALPAFRAARTPLVGAMTVRTTKPSRRRRHPIRMNFASIWRSGLRRDKKFGITVFLYVFAAALLTSAVWGSHLLMETYYRRVLLSDAPDFEITLYQAPSEISLEAMDSALREIGIFSRVDSARYVSGGILAHPIVSQVERYRLRHEQNDAADQLKMVKKLKPELLDHSMRVTTYALIEKSDITRRLFESSFRSYDTESFQRFDADPTAAILILPYHDAESGETDYDYRMRGRLNDGYPIETGEAVDLMTEAEVFTENGPNRIRVHRTLQLKGVVVGLGRDGIWPLSYENEEPILVLSNAAMSELFQNTRSSRMFFDYEVIDALIRELGWESYGRARINLYLREGLDPVNARSLIDHFLATSKHSFAPAARVENNFNMRNFEYEKALRLIIILSTLGISVFMILMMIQYNIGISKIENEREQLGALRALGVTKMQYRWTQGATGLSISLFAIVAANLLFVGAYLIYGLRWQIGVWNGLLTSLHHFPWLLYGLSQLVFLIVAATVYYAPIRGVLKLQPIENINALQR